MLEEKDDFLSYTEISPKGCWNWIGKERYGYGRYGNTPAHVKSYQLFIGPILVGSIVHHLCKNHLCVNPEHLTCVSKVIHTALHKYRR